MPYQPWLIERVERYRAFFADKTPGQILVTLALWDMGIDLGVPGGRPLNAWDFETETDAFAEQRVRHLRAAIALHREIGDDWIPYASPGAGIALNSIYYSGAAMIPGKSTSWVHPVIHDWDDLAHLRPDPENRWFRFIRQVTERFVALNEGDYVVQTFSHFAPMDMANALRGNTLFTDFYDAPAQVHALTQRCVEGIVWLEREQRKIVPIDVAGGTVIWGTWVPGPVIFMSEDAPDLCSAETYVEFGRPYTNQVSEAMGGAWIHHHARGYQVHQAVAQVKDLRLLQISLDPNCEPPIHRLDDLYMWNGDLPLMTHCHARDVYEHIDQIKQGRLVLMLTADDLAEARETLAFIRQHSQV
jgi:hypothetical protein